MLLRILWWLLQVTWCLPQNVIGAVLYLYHRRQEHLPFRGALVTKWKHRGCTSLGCFIFMQPGTMHDRPLLVHEYGHTLQSAVLGWLYLPLILLPSVLWFSLPACRRYRRTHRRSYYSFYTERWANHWGERAAGDPSVGKGWIQE